MDQIIVALVISSLALFISFCSLAWSIWSKFIEPKPKIKVNFAVIILAGNGTGDLNDRAIQVSATNFGPNDVVIGGVEGRSRHFVFPRFKTEHFVVVATSVWPTGSFGGDIGGFPSRLAVGDTGRWYIPIDGDYFDRHEMTHFGLSDSFGRYHWAKKKAVQKVRSELLKRKSQLIE